MKQSRSSIRAAILAGSALALASGAAQAISFSIPTTGDETIEAVLNTTITMGAQWRTQGRANDLVGKSNLDPGVCGRNPDGTARYQSCQGLFRGQTFLGQHLADAPGTFSVNTDDGNLNYEKGDTVAAPLKITQDLTLTIGDIGPFSGLGLFTKALFFYDFINNDFEEFHPNLITDDNYLQVGNLSHNSLSAPTDTVVRSESTPCGDRTPDDATQCGIVYGPGGIVRKKRDDGETLRQIGSDLQLLDLVFYGAMPLPFEKELTFKIGKQTVNWGESTFLAFGSLNQANPINTNNFLRVGFAVEEVFTPVGMVFLSTELFEGSTIESFYQYEWKPLEIPAYGSFFSFTDLGSNNGGLMSANIGYGGETETRTLNSVLLDNPLSGITNTSLRATRLPDLEPRDNGQYGVSLKYFADWLNNGTELSVYYMNYHSRIPQVSLYAVGTSCAKGTISGPTFAATCSDSPVFHGAGDPTGATDSSVKFDDLRLQLEYPEDIKMYGFSFNTTLGDLSIQGEVAYRPEEPLQVDIQDLANAAFGPTLADCHLESAGCIGTNAGVGLFPDGSEGTYGSGDYVVDDGGTPGDPNDPSTYDDDTEGAYPDTYDLGIGGMSGSGRSFPSFVIPYRGGVMGLNPACEQPFMHGTTTPNPAFRPFTKDLPCYIRGYELMETYQFNLGGTYVAGATERLSQIFGADQVIALFEFGATYVPDMPSLDLLQFEAFGTDASASAGADGSGADRSRQACSYDPVTLAPFEGCSFGGDGARFNPHQADLDLYPDKLSWGYDIIALIRYESVLPGISLQPIILWKHDVNGTSPSLASNFIAGRRVADVQMEIRYKSAFAFNIGYQWHTGAGSANYWRDRDNARAWIKYQF